MGANDDESYPFLADLKHWIRVIVAAGVPFLGICLGGQLLAAAHGGGVHSNRWGEKGICNIELTEAGSLDPLFSGLGSILPTFQWHEDSFDLPMGAILLAESRTCPHQAFRIGSNAWGTQFHPEVTLEIIHSWFLEGNRSDQLSHDFEQTWRSLEQAFLSTADRILKNFISTFTRGD